MRFDVRRIDFGRHDQDDDHLDAEGIPRPHIVKLKARRAAGVREAKETLAVLPGPGESLHAIMTARLDMTDVLNALLEKLGMCERAMIATLGYNSRNFQTMLHWLDCGAIGSLALVASLFFRSHNGDLWEETVEELRSRGQRAVCCPCHCKVMALSFSNGARMSIEGSANLCSNGSAREQFCLVNDAGLCDWHSKWIEALVVKYA
jgi:hypothetical protein